MRLQRLLPIIVFVGLSVPILQAQMGGGSYPGRSRGGGVMLPPAVPGGGRSQPDKTKKSDQQVLPSFAGTIKSADAKTVSIERPDGNIMDFHCSKKTKFYDGSKKIKPADLKQGDRVTVEGRREIDASLEAVNIRLEHGKPPAPEVKAEEAN